MFVHYFVNYFVRLWTKHYTLLTISLISFIFDSARNLTRNLLYRHLWHFMKIPIAWWELRKAKWEKWLARRFTKCYLYTSHFFHFANIFSRSRQFDDKCIAGYGFKTENKNVVSVAAILDAKSNEVGNAQWVLLRWIFEKHFLILHKIFVNLTLFSKNLQIYPNVNRNFEPNFEKILYILKTL